jgi:hypothetical protein
MAIEKARETPLPSRAQTATPLVAHRNAPPKEHSAGQHASNRGIRRPSCKRRSKMQAGSTHTSAPRAPERVGLDGRRVLRARVGHARQQLAARRVGRLPRDLKGARHPAQALQRARRPPRRGAQLFGARAPVDTRAKIPKILFPKHRVLKKITAKQRLGARAPVDTSAPISKIFVF